MTELLVGTKKGLFALAGRRRARSRSRRARSRASRSSSRPATRERPLPRLRHVGVLRAEGLRHRRPRGRMGAGARARAARGRREAARAALVDRARRGGRPPVRGRRAGRPLREPRRRHDLGAQQAFWEQPTRPEWSPGAGGMCMHSIATWPGDPSRIALAISAVGVWLSDDGGKTWRHGNKGLVPRYMPEEAREGHAHALRPQHAPPPGAARAPVHAVPRRRVPLGRRGRDLDRHRDRHGLPSDFGFPLVIDPDDPDSAYVIPLVADLDRVTPDGRVRVYETRDAGATWTARGDGLPAGGRVPDDPPAGVLARGAGAAHGPLLRRDVGRRLRLGRRGSDVVHGGDEAPAGALGARRVRATRAPGPRPRR